MEPRGFRKKQMLKLHEPEELHDISSMTEPFYDAIIHAEVLLPQGETVKSAKVKGRSKDSDGNIVGTYDNNPLLNSMLYDVEFPDGAVKKYAANTITQNMYEQVDGEGYSTSKVDSIVDYDKDKDAVLMKDK